MNRLNPNLAAMLMSRLQQRTDMSGRSILPQFAGQGGQGGGLDPNLAAMLMASGQMGKHQNMQGQYMLPGGQSGSALDNQSFSGLDANRSMQRNPSSMDRYSNPTFSMGPARIEKPVKVAPVTSAEMSANNLEMAKWRRMAQEQKTTNQNYAPIGTRTDWAQGVSQAPPWMSNVNSAPKPAQDYRAAPSPQVSDYQYQGPPLPGGFQPNLNPQPPYVPQGPPMPEPYQSQSMFQRFGGSYPSPPPYGSLGNSGQIIGNYLKRKVLSRR